VRGRETIKADSKTITVGNNPIYTKEVAIIIKPHKKKENDDTTIIYKTIIRFSSLLCQGKSFFICFLPAEAAIP
jgi:hypothetical protein